VNLLSHERRWFLDAGLAGGIALWQAWTLATETLAPVEVVFAVCSMVAASGVLFVLLQAR
jgi:hypothetical protein